MEHCPMCNGTDLEDMQFYAFNAIAKLKNPVQCLECGHVIDESEIILDVDGWGLVK